MKNSIFYGFEKIFLTKQTQLSYRCSILKKTTENMENKPVFLLLKFLPKGLFLLFYLLFGFAFCEVSQLPLVLNFTGQDQSPNLMIVSDDSSSMLVEQMGMQRDHVLIKDQIGSYFDKIFRIFPDPIDESGLVLFFPNSKNLIGVRQKITAMQWRCRSFNKSFYDPEQVYLPWVNHDGKRFNNADPKMAYRNPMKKEHGYLDLTISQSATAYWAVPFMKNRPEKIEENFFPAIYYFCDQKSPNDVSSYKEIQIKPSINSYRKGKNRTDCKGSTCSYEDEIQNFANWFSYSRNRNLILRGALTETLSQVPPNVVRIGYGKINNKIPVEIDGQPTSIIELGVRDFLSSGKDREKIFDAILKTESPVSGANTPLMASGEAVGGYFSRTDELGPWSSTPGQSGGVIHPCRRSRYLVSTDGDASDYRDPNFDFIGNSDNEDGDLIQSSDGRKKYRYFAGGSPYADNKDSTLADVAISFWKSDLLPDSPNALHSTSLSYKDTVRDGFWQNLSTDALVINAPPSISEKSVRKEIIDGHSLVDWGRPGTSDDLMHATFNSGGFFESTTSAYEVKEGLSRIIKASVKQIKDGVISKMGIGKDFSSGYRAIFNSSDWSGDIIAESVSDKVRIWNASEKLASPEKRNITSIRDDNRKAIDFKWSEISDNQKNLLKDEKVLNYLRGDREGEVSGSFRLRGKSLLGDFLDSPVAFTNNENKKLFLPLKYRIENGYDAWLKRKDDEKKVLCVGSNDGMLHCFNGDINGNNGGEEVFAYVPSEVYKKLHELTKFSYIHQYFVNGDIKIEDVFFRPLGRSEGWYRVLIGGLGAGGRSYFAIDVSDPSNLNKSRIFWESRPDPDEGFSSSKIEVGLFKDGKWRMITGNGPDSPSKKSVLVLRNISDGSIFKKIEVESRGGLSSPFLKRNEDGEVDSVYSGDFEGNIWKFDLSNQDPNFWYARKLFENSGPVQKPVTVRPIMKEISGKNWVFFGTGSVLNKDDLDQKFVARIYGLLDTDETLEEGELQKKELKEKKILGKKFYEVQEMEQPISKKGWYINLDKEGERLIKDPDFDSGFVRFVTIGPPDKVIDPNSIVSCAESAGNSRVFILDPTTGGADKIPTFDTNQDEKIGSADILGLVGYLTSPTFNLISHKKKEDGSDLGSCLRNLYSRDVGGSSSQVLSRAHSSVCRYKRLSWRQIY